MNLDRASGILLHPTSLPGKYGIGDLGMEAYNFIDFLKNSKQKLWQILPLNPTGEDGSPYQSYSAFAGNYLIISIDKLIEEGLLSKVELNSASLCSQDKVCFSKVKDYKNKLFYKSFKNFKVLEKSQKYKDFIEENSYWLDDYALFMALKKYYKGLPWNSWEKSIAFREKTAIDYFRGKLHEEIEFHCFLQYLFFAQWIDIKNYANSQGINIIGDLPIFISYDSSDTWKAPDLFELDKLGNPVKVAGVPPDYFSNTGQLWGNPHYKWEQMKNDDYKWWRDRFEHILKLVDYVRVDHFRGFEAYWEVPAGEKTSVNGRWVKGPGENFFNVLNNYLGKLPIIAEDLGYITDAVKELKNKYSFPGMKVLQFTTSEDLSSRQEEDNTVYYTGTHDNDTLLSWYKNIILSGTSNLNLHKAGEICWDFIEVVMQSNAKWVITPMQDILCLDNEARMNTPGTTKGNWQWRLRQGCLTKKIENKLAFLTVKYRRG